MSTMIDAVKKTVNFDEYVALRREMHKFPATGFEETFASGIVQRKLTELGIPFKAGIAVTGVVATIEGQKSSSGKSVGIRAEMDALDIVETSGQPWCSTIPGKMHGCGHDGQTATVLALAEYLSKTRNFNGTVQLIFQPAEEGMGGAYKMIEEGAADEFPVDAYFGYHNWPLVPLGHFETKEGFICASSDRFEITITGKGGHAAWPHRCINPISVGSAIVQAYNGIIGSEVSAFEPAVLSICNIHAGAGAMNVIPETLVVNGTVRTYNNDVKAHMMKAMEERAKAIAASMGAKIEYKYYDVIGAVFNDPAITRFGLECAQKLGTGPVSDQMLPSMGGDDFGAWSQKKPGVYMPIGQGMPDANSPHNYPLHSPHYDYNDLLMPIAAGWYAQVVEDYLPL